MGVQTHGELWRLSEYPRPGALGMNRGGIRTSAWPKGGTPQGRGAGGTPRALLSPSQQEEEAARESGVGEEEEEEEEDGAAASEGNLAAGRVPGFGDGKTGSKMGRWRG